MRTLEIEEFEDSHDCDTCGVSCARGARFTLDGKVVKELIPVAGCFGGNTWNEQAIMQAALEVVGVTDVRVDMGYAVWEEGD